MAEQQQQQQQGWDLDREHFCCSVCLDLLKVPVSLPCGHSYCSSCIEAYWDRYAETGVYRCPQCRESFSPRPVLRKNTLLAEVVMKLRSTGAQQSTEHKGHDTVSSAAEKAEKQKQRVKSQEEVQQKIQEKKKELKDLRQVLEDLNRSAEAAVEANDRIFSEMMVSIERRRAELKQLIRDQQQNAAAEAEAVLRPLELTLEQLERRHAELGELSNTEDTFVQSFQSLSSWSGSHAVSPSVLVRPLRSFTDVTDVLFALRDQLDNILKTAWPQIAERVCAVDVVQPPAEPQTRKDFLRYSSPLSLDINTVHKRLSLSEDKRKVTLTGQQQPYPAHAERFTAAQVLCTEGLSERRYWEVETSGTGVGIAVCYKDTNRHSWFGYDDKSWCFLYNGKDDCMLRHNSVNTKVSGPYVSSRVGVYLDHKAGTLSFYSVSDTMTLLHTVRTTFRQPLYPGIGIRLLRNGVTAELC